MKKINPQDIPKVIGLIALLVIAFGYIGFTLMNAGRKSGPVAVATRPPEPSVVRNQPTAPRVDANSSLAALDEQSDFTYTPTDDPFKSPLPRRGPNSGGITANNERGEAPPPIPGPSTSGGSGSGSGGGVVPPYQFPNDGSVVTRDYPEVRTLGVIVDDTPGGPNSYAVVSVAGRNMYIRNGEEIAEALQVVRVTEAGIWLKAGPQRVFAEIGRVVKPTGIPAQKPTSAGS